MKTFKVDTLENRSEERDFLDLLTFMLSSIGEPMDEKEEKSNNNNAKSVITSTQDYQYALSEINMLKKENKQLRRELAHALNDISELRKFEKQVEIINSTMESLEKLTIEYGERMKRVQ